MEAAQKISTGGQAGIRVLHETVELPRRTDVPERIQALLAEQEKILQSYTNAGPVGGIGLALNFKSFLPLYITHSIDPQHPSDVSYLYQEGELPDENGRGRLDTENGQRVEIYRRCVENMDRLIMLRTNLGILQRRLERRESGPILADVHALKIGDFVLVTFPGEIFVEIGLRIKERSPFRHTFVAGYTNGSIGYAPTADDYDKQAYEDSSTRLAPQWQAIYEQKALELIGRLGSPN